MDGPVIRVVSLLLVLAIACERVSWSAPAQDVLAPGSGLGKALLDMEQASLTELFLNIALAGRGDPEFSDERFEQEIRVKIAQVNRKTGIHLSKVIQADSVFCLDGACYLLWDHTPTWRRPMRLYIKGKEPFHLMPELPETPAEGEQPLLWEKPAQEVSLAIVDPTEYFKMKFVAQYVRSVENGDGKVCQEAFVQLQKLLSPGDLCLLLNHLRLDNLRKAMKRAPATAEREILATHEWIAAELVQCKEVLKQEGDVDSQKKAVKKLGEVIYALSKEFRHLVELSVMQGIEDTRWRGDAREEQLAIAFAEAVMTVRYTGRWGTQEHFAYALQAAADEALETTLPVPREPAELSQSRKEFNAIQADFEMVEDIQSSDITREFLTTWSMMVLADATVIGILGQIMGWGTLNSLALGALIGSVVFVFRLQFPSDIFDRRLVAQLRTYWNLRRNPELLEQLRDRRQAMLQSVLESLVPGMPLEDQGIALDSPLAGALYESELLREAKTKKVEVSKLTALIRELDILSIEVHRFNLEGTHGLKPTPRDIRFHRMDLLMILCIVPWALVPFWQYLIVKCLIFIGIAGIVGPFIHNDLADMLWQERQQERQKKEAAKQLLQKEREILRSIQKMMKPGVPARKQGIPPRIEKKLRSLPPPLDAQGYLPDLSVAQEIFGTAL